MERRTSRGERGTAPLILLATGIVVVLACVAAALLILRIGPFAEGEDRVLTIVDPAGNTILGATVVLERKGQNDAWVQTHEGNGRAVIAAEKIHAGATMYVFAPGCRLRTGRLPERDERIPLGPGLAVSIRLKEGLQVPEPPFVLEIELTPLDVDRPEPHFWEHALAYAVTSPEYHELDEKDKGAERHLIDADTGKVDLLVPAPGRWNVAVSVMHYKVMGAAVTGAGRGLGDGSETVIEVLDTDEPQVFEIALDVKAYEQVLAEMRRDGGG